jgi:hypothetical protein
MSPGSSLALLGKGALGAFEDNGSFGGGFGVIASAVVQKRGLSFGRSSPSPWKETEDRDAGASGSFGGKGGGRLVIEAKDTLDMLAAALLVA